MLLSSGVEPQPECELRPAQEEPGGCRTSEVHIRVHPEAGGGVQHRQATPGQHDGRRPGDLHPGGHRCKQHTCVTTVACAALLVYVVFIIQNQGYMAFVCLIIR